MNVNQEDRYQLLIDCLRNDENDSSRGLASRLLSLSPEDRQHFLVLAQTQRVMPMIFHRLKQKNLVDGLPLDMTQALQHALFKNTLRNLNFYGELKNLLSILKSQGIPLILLKGIYIADAIYGDIGLREMNDMDVLARPGDLDRIFTIMTSMGYRSIQSQPIDPNLILETHNHLPRMLKGGKTGCEIHWNVTVPGKSYSIDPEGLWERALPVRTLAGEALTLSPEDLLLHLCLHVSYQHHFVFGLRPFLDIAETISRNPLPLDWSVITARAIQNKWRKGVFLALKLTSELIGAKVPTDVLKTLYPMELPSNVWDVARALIFSDKHLDHTLPVSVANLLESDRFWDKIKILWHRVFLPKAHIASAYGVPVDSIRIYGYYLRRFIDLYRHHNAVVKKYKNNDPALKAFVARKNMLTHWIAPSS